MLAKNIVVSLLLISASVSVFAEDDESTQGSFHGEVSDGSQLTAYNNFLDSLKESKTWIALGAVRKGGALDSFKGYKSASAVYLAMVKENGSKELPAYDSDSLGLSNIDGFRKYAVAAKSNPSFLATSEACGAALTYAYTAAMTNLLMHYRPVYTLHRTVMQNELSGLQAQIDKETQEDYGSITLMCKNQSDHGLVASLEAVYNNLSADVTSVLPLVDRNYELTEYPYIATVSCGMGDGNINVRACFKSTDLKIVTSGGAQLYKIYNMDQAGTIDRQGLHIKLPEHFFLIGQNDHNLLILSLVVKDRSGNVVYSDKQGQYGVVSITR